MREKLAKFVTANRFRGKGPLSVGLVITDHAKTLGLPLDPHNLLTAKEGQVRGLGPAKVQAILANHGIERVLAKEAGRTSRGSIEKMRAYVSFLNELQAEGEVDLAEVELFWVDQVREFFAGKPFKFKVDGSLGLRSVIRELMSQAQARQKEMPGTMYLGTMMQHLVGAKLGLVIPDGALEHHGSNENDEQDGRTGDFDIGDVSIHVSSSPSEALMRKCEENIAAGRKPIIVCPVRGVGVAEGLAENMGILERLDVLEFEQFIATNLHELAAFQTRQCRLKINDLLEGYNAIIDEHETDPSLKIEIAKGR